MNGRLKFGSSLFSVEYMSYCPARLLRRPLPLCCGFVAGWTSISSRIYRDVADVADQEGGRGTHIYPCPSTGNGPANRSSIPPKTARNLKFLCKVLIQSDLRGFLSAK